MQHSIYKYDVRIQKDGTLELKHLPFKKGMHVEVVLMEREEDDLSDLLRASTTTLDFWDNPIDDEEWNDA